MTDPIDGLNALSPDAAERELLTCCASRRWARDVAAARPFASADALVAQGAAMVGTLDWDEVGEALAAHPRIGERRGGADREAAWSRREQSGTRAAAGDVLQALAEGNVEYEQRFGHVFLICATGKSAEDMLKALRERLEHGVEDEREVVRSELASIVGLRLGKLVSGA